MSEAEKYTWKFYLSTNDTWKAMYEDCINAKKSIEFEQYIFENDDLGKAFLQLFIEKAKQGLEVYIICDKFGSSAMESMPELAEFKKHGGQFATYNTLYIWNLFTPWRWFPRTHTKTLLIDSEIAYTGGVCLAERMQNWRDTHIRFTGPLIKEVRLSFDMLKRKIPRRKAMIEARMRESGNFYYVRSRPVRTIFAIYREFIKQIKTAEKYIYITSAFFVPNKRFIKLLKLAQNRGVEVKVLITKHSDVNLADWASLSYLRSLMKRGVKVYHYEKSVLHSKTIVVDDKWGTVGSTNMDILSFFYNREANVMTTHEEAVAELKSHFEQDLKHSTELTEEIWNAIPLWKKIVGQLAKLLKVFFKDV